MDRLIVDGGRTLRGTIPISGSKNAALPILLSTLLTDEVCEITRVPRLRDIRTTVRLLESLGKKVEGTGHTVVVGPRAKLKTRAPYDIVKQMRASVLVAGPLLARFRQVRVPLPGGCAIGLRPIDIHIQGFLDLGARRGSEGGDVILSGKLKPGLVKFRFPSVGATENMMMAAAALPGLTVIHNAAREPEISDLALFLSRMGARVDGAGTSTVSVQGAARLRGARHTVFPDRIETGTFLLACAAAGGRVLLKGASAVDLKALIICLRRAGVLIEERSGGLLVAMSCRPRPVNVTTAVHPGFPTDVQAPWMSLMCLALGKSRVVETVFENRFLHAAELSRMGAELSVRGRQAVITGVPRLSGAPVMASDIRAGAALLVAALAAKGRTEISRVYHIDRGYEGVEFKLRAVGARIRRVKA